MGIDDGRCRLTFVSHPCAPLLERWILHLLEHASSNPAYKGFVDSLPGRKCGGQQPPGAAGAQHVGTGVEQLAPAILRRGTSVAWRALKQVGDHVPISIGQFGAVEGNVFAAVRRRIALGAWVLCRPSGTPGAP